MGNSSRLNRERFLIIQGEDVILPVRFVTRNSTPGVFDNFDLTGLTEACLQFNTTDGQGLEKKLSLGEVTVSNALNGQTVVTLSDTDTALLEASRSGDFVAILDFGTTRRIIKFTDAIQVEEC